MNTVTQNPSLKTGKSGVSLCKNISTDYKFDIDVDFGVQFPMKMVKNFNYLAAKLEIIILASKCPFLRISTFKYKFGYISPLSPIR